MKTLTALIAVCALAMVTGCAASKPVAMAPVAAAEPDPWEGYKDGRVETAPKESKESAPPTEAAASKPASTDEASPLAEDTAPVPAKKAGKKKKARSGAIAGKKPRKRAKRSS